MTNFTFKNNTLHAENVDVNAIAKKHGTPTYIYSRKAIETEFFRYFNAVSANDMVCYAVKANSNLAVINLLAQSGAGFDIVSVGELERVLAAGGLASKVVFSGVAKKSAEIKRALEVGIHCINVESVAELERINEVALSMGKKAPVSLRVNPDVDAKTHPYISTGLKDNKFGIHIDKVLSVYRKANAMGGIEILGIDFHIGSQIIDPQPFVDALKPVLALIEALKTSGIVLKHIDIGGGLGVQYDKEAAPDIAQFIDTVKAIIAPTGLDLILEPGRSIVANAGIVITEVEYTKDNDDKHFAIVDAGMNDLLRPALYQSWMMINNVNAREGDKTDYDIVGPVCESSDFLGKHRSLCIQAGDLLSVSSAGAYGFGMSSNYNTRPRAAEVMVDGEQFHLIRKREEIADLYRDEELLPK